jgi:micrococcal nuclease
MKLKKINLAFDNFFVYILLAIVVFFLLTNLFNQELNLDFTKSLNIQTGNAKNNENTELKKISEKLETGKVKKVIDGDTIEMENGIRIRLLNIDTPESVKPNTPVMCYALEAKTKLNELILNREIYLTFDKNKQDRYGRELRFVYINQLDAINNNVDESVNAFMIKAGFARAMLYSPNTTYKQQFLNYQYSANQAKLGVWNNCSKPFEI